MRKTTVRVSWNSWRVKLLLLFYDDLLPDTSCGLWICSFGWLSVNATFPALAVVLLLTLWGVDVDRLYAELLPPWGQIAIGAWAIATVAFIIVRFLQNHVLSATTVPRRILWWCKSVEYM